MDFGKDAADEALCAHNRDIDNLLVRIHFFIVMIRWSGLAPWAFEFPFPGRLTSTLQAMDFGKEEADAKASDLNPKP